MDGPPSQEAHQIDELVLAIEDLRRRVDALERQPSTARESGAFVHEAHASTLPADLSSGLLASLGRVLLGIAGAYLLRAITEADLVPHIAGTLLGVVYACAWLIVAQRAARANRWAAPLQGAAASAVLGPLLWEATIRFHTITPPVAAAILAIFIVQAQWLSWRSDLSQLAGIVAVAGSATSIALIMATLNPLPFTIALAVSAAAVEYGACRDRALATRWVIALPADFCAFLLAYLITRRGGFPRATRPFRRPRPPRCCGACWVSISQARCSGR